MLRIGEFARLGEVSIKLVRHYDEIGLLPAHAIDPNTGYRYYSVTQLTRLNQLRVYRSLGFSLKEIRTLLREDAPSEQLREMLTRRRDNLRTKMDVERARFEEVEARIAQIDGDRRRLPFQITIRSVDMSVAVSLRRTCGSYDDVGDLLQHLRAKLSPSAAVTGHGAIWHRCLGSTDQIDCEALVFLDSSRSSYPTGLNVVKVPPSTVASVVCDEATDDSRSAYRAAIDRARHLGYKVAGPMRERYLRYGDHDTTATEAQFPLAPERGARSMSLDE